jgi:thiol-disulfide isomerase/thioredoxin
MTVAAYVRFLPWLLLRRARIAALRLTLGIVLFGAISVAGAIFPYAIGFKEAAAHGSDHPSALRNNSDQFTLLRPRKPAPMMPILAADGTLADLGKFRGKVVLLNIWATWCAPCIRELPALDRLQAALGGQDFTVVALSIDAGEIDVPVSFVRRLGLQDLRVYSDFTGDAAKAFTLYGLPITYLIDASGDTVGYLTGSAEWDSPAAVGFLKHYIE